MRLKLLELYRVWLIFFLETALLDHSTADFFCLTQLWFSSLLMRWIYESSVLNKGHTKCARQDQSWEALFLQLTISMTLHLYEGPFNVHVYYLSVILWTRVSCCCIWQKYNLSTLYLTSSFQLSWLTKNGYLQSSWFTCSHCCSLSMFCFAHITSRMTYVCWVDQECVLFFRETNFVFVPFVVPIIWIFID